MADRQILLFADDTLQKSPHVVPQQVDRLARYLSSRCPMPVEVMFTDNRSTMISVNRSPGRARLRLHRMFAHAPQAVLDALAIYIKWPRHGRSNATLSSYINENTHFVRPGRPGKVKLVARGKYFDLRQVYDRLNREHFGGALDAPITWGRPFRGRRRRSIRFGCVDNTTGVIRINASLDAPFVPEFFLEYIVYHEMLHCQVDARRGPGGRSVVHHQGFKRREKEYPRYKEALRWQKENLHRFLGTRR